jgi:hypothetical protein
VNVWWSLVACLSAEEVASTLEDAVATANDALAVALIATELRSQAREPASPELRHATTCGCPCRVIVGEGDVFLMELDYHPEGCLPSSGLVAGGVSGAILLEVDHEVVRATLDGGGVGGAPLSGVLRGAVARDPGGPVDSVGALTLGERAFAVDLSARWDGARFLVSGDVDVDGVPVSFDGLAVGPEGLADRCPTPDRGVAVVDAGRRVEITYGAPGPGSLLAAFGPHTSTPTDPCRFASRLY